MRRWADTKSVQRGMFDAFDSERLEGVMTSAIITSTQPIRRWYSETWRSAVLAIAVAIAGGAVIGGLTSFGQVMLPYWASSLADSSGGWTMFTFLIIWLGRSKPLLASVLGIVVFELLNESYGVVTGWRGFSYYAPFSSIWTQVGVVCGPIIGVAASLTRHGSPLWRVLGVTPLSAVLLGEGVWALQTISTTTSPVYWTAQIVLSALFLGFALLRQRLQLRWSMLVVGVWLLGAAAFYFVVADVL